MGCYAYYEYLCFFSWASSQNFTLVIFLMHNGTWAPYVFAIFHISLFGETSASGPARIQNDSYIHSPVPISIRKRKRSSRATCHCKLSDHWEFHCLRSKFPSMVKQNGNLRKSEFNVLDLYFPHWSNSPQTHQLSFLAYTLTPILIKKKYVLFFLFLLILSKEVRYFLFIFLVQLSSIAVTFLLWVVMMIKY